MILEKMFACDVDFANKFLLTMHTVYCLYIKCICHRTRGFRVEDFENGVRLDAESLVYYLSTP